MKKFYTIFIVAFVFLFTSCFDYVQSISYEDGEYRLYYKVAFSRVFLEMSEIDSSDLIEEFEPEDIVAMGPNFKINPVETDLESGIEFSVTVDSKTNDPEQKKLLPSTSGSKYYIPFAVGEETDSFSDEFNFSSSEEDMIALALLSSVKCRVLVSKKIVPQVEVAYFEGRGGQHYSIPVYDYGDNFCFEVPVLLFAEDDKYRFDRIVVLKGQI